MKWILAQFKRKEFVFCITAYPCVVLICLVIPHMVGTWPAMHPEYFALLSLLCAGFLIIEFLFEIIIKIFSLRTQGDKLKIRQQQGQKSDIKDIKEWNHAHR